MVQGVGFGIFYKGQIMGFVVAGDPCGKARAVGVVADFGHVHSKHFSAKALGFFDAGTVQQEVVEADSPHTVGRLCPNIGVLDLGNVFAKFHFREDVEFMTGGDGKFVPFAEAGLIGIGGDFAYFAAKFFSPAFHRFKLILVNDLEADKIKPGSVSLAKHYAMMIEFIIGLEHYPSITGTADFCKTKNVLVEVESFVKIQHFKLN